MNTQQEQAKEYQAQVDSLTSGYLRNLEQMGHTSPGLHQHLLVDITSVVDGYLQAEPKINSKEID